MTTQLKPSQKANIAHEADVLSVLEPKEEREQSKKDYIGNTTKLNLQVNRRLEKFLKENTDVLLGSIPNVPIMVQQMLKVQREQLGKWTQQIMTELSAIQSPATRVLMVSYLKDVLKYLLQSIVEKEIAQDKRKGVLLQ
jgi:hypothetical protein